VLEVTRRPVQLIINMLRTLDLQGEALTPPQYCPGSRTYKTVKASNELTEYDKYREMNKN